MLPLVVGLLGLGAGMQAVMVGAIDTSLIVQGTTAQIATNAVAGTNVGIGVLPIHRSGTADVNVVRVGLANGKLDGLCLSQVQSVVAGLDVMLKITAGNGIAGDYEIVGKNAVLDATTVRGNGPLGEGLNFDGMVQLGVAAFALTTTGPGTGATFDPDPNPLGAPLTTGYFGIDSDIAQLKQLKGNVYDVQIGGPFTIPGLKIEVVPALGAVGCADASTPYPM